MHLFNYFQLSRADIEGYTGEGELPPHCEMTFKADGKKEQRGDLQFCATIEGMEASPIEIKRTYEQGNEKTKLLTMYDGGSTLLLTVTKYVSRLDIDIDIFLCRPT